MEGLVLPGVPAELQVIVTTVIGLLAAWITEALTAIWKKQGKTSGATTVGVSLVLSVAVSLGFSVTSALNGGEINIGQAIMVALIAFIRSNGAYLLRKQANASANKEADAAAKKQPQPVVVTDPYVAPTRRPIEDGVTPTTDADFGPTPAGIGPTPTMTAD